MDILYSDKHIAVCVKPVGMDSEHEVPAALQETLGGDIFPIHREGSYHAEAADSENPSATAVRKLMLNAYNWRTCVPRNAALTAIRLLRKFSREQDRVMNSVPPSLRKEQKVSEEF